MTVNSLPHRGRAEAGSISALMRSGSNAVGLKEPPIQSLVDGCSSCVGADLNLSYAAT